MVHKLRHFTSVFFAGCCLLISTAGVAQKIYTTNDSVRIYELLDKADEADNSGNLDESVKYANEALAMSRTVKMMRGEGFALLKLADLKLKKEGTENIVDLFNAPLKIGEHLKDSFLIGLTHHQKGQMYLNSANYNEADDWFEHALNYYRPDKEAHYRALVFNERGYMFDRQGEYAKAVDMYLQAIRFFEKENNEKEIANTLGNIGVSNFRMGNKEEAITMFKKSAALREKLGDAKGLAATYGNLVTAYSGISLDSSFRYQEKAIANAQKTGVKNNLAQAYANAATLLTRMKKYKEAEEYLQKAIQLYKEVGDRLKVGNQYIGLANLQQLLNDSAKAEEYFKEAEAIASSQKNKLLFQSLYQAKSNFYNARNNYKLSYDYYKQYYNYRDSIVNEKNTATMAELQTKYETEKKDNEIARLSTEQKIKQLEIEKQKAVIAGNRQLAEKKETQIQLLQQQQLLRDAQLKQQKEDLDKQVLLNKTNEQQLLLSVQELQIAENEKKIRMRQLDKERLLRNGIIGAAVLILLVGGLLFNRYQLRKKIEEQQALLEVRNKISKDLHDDIGSTLTSIHILSNVSEEAIEHNPQQAKAMIHDIAMQSKTIQQNMSDIVWAIRPDNGKIENLSARMREYIGQTLEPNQVKTTFTVNEAILGTTLTMEFRKELLLIYKEAINNIVKHSGATGVTIELEGTTHQLEMRITDNGRWKEKLKSSGTGTYSMKQRAEVLGGSLAITGSDTGTEVKLTVPLP
ncbi:MAG: tetratricopeptide repeat protein [Chitinophagaceae bacterium]|nr:tetratricopeptide repeat protein [Chitinophagaceae bacterium]